MGKRYEGTISAAPIAKQLRQLGAEWDAGRVVVPTKTSQALFSGVVHWLLADCYLDINRCWDFSLTIGNPNGPDPVILASLKDILKLLEYECRSTILHDNEPEMVDGVLETLRQSVKRIERIRRTTKPK